MTTTTIAVRRQKGSGDEEQELSLVCTGKLPPPSSSTTPHLTPHHLALFEAVLVPTHRLVCWTQHPCVVRGSVSTNTLPRFL